MKPLSYSANATLMSCAQKYKYGYIDNWEKREESVPAYAGKCMAEALLWLHTEGKDQWKLDTDLAHTGVVEALETSWGDFKTPPGRHEYLTIGHLETVLYYYIRDRHPEQVMPLSERGNILAEQKVTFDWPMQLGDKLDLIKVTGIPDIPALVAGQQVVVDWKCSTLHVNDWWAKKFSVIGHQLRTYMEMMRHEYGIQTVAAYVDGIHIGPKAAQDDKAWSKLKSVRSRLFGPYNFTESQRRETWQWYRSGEKIRELHEAEGFWPQNEGACSDYGGCEFQSLCGISPVVREANAAQMYRQKKER